MGDSGAGVWGAVTCPGYTTKKGGARAGGQLSTPITGLFLWQLLPPAPAHTPAPSPARTWASWSSGSSDMELLEWTLPLGSLVSMSTGELGFEDAGAPFGRACSRKERHCENRTPPAAHGACGRASSVGLTLSPEKFHQATPLEHSFLNAIIFLY